MTRRAERGPALWFWRGPGRAPPPPRRAPGNEAIADRQLENCPSCGTLCRALVFRNRTPAGSE
eukprot:2213121-Lingulodinium_polyedra.AAC.1